ncbi:MAG: hypothetical protein U0930_07745 [Pirellulales bacterium]
MTESEDVLLERFMSLNETHVTVTPEQFLKSLSVQLSPDEFNSLKQNLESSPADYSSWPSTQISAR